MMIAKPCLVCVGLAATLLILGVPGASAAGVPHQQSQRPTRPDSRVVKLEGGKGTEKSLRAALDWLVKHQNEAGFWDCDGFGQECKTRNKSACPGPGNGVHDVGVTGLAVLALSGTYSTVESGKFRRELARAVDWLIEQQDSKSGLIGSDGSYDFIYDHLIATYALCEAMIGVDDDARRKSVQLAVDLIVSAQVPGSGWRYDVPPLGDIDTSVTSWALTALRAARAEGFDVPNTAFEGGLAWIDEVSDPNTGRIGYDTPGSLSSRTPANERYGRREGEALTAAGLWCRYLLGQNREETKLIPKHVTLVRAKPPTWTTEADANDMYYWYYGTYAMFQSGGEPWNVWNNAMKRAVIDSQHTKGELRGSWDPVGPWGYSGGRVYSTALMALCLEVYFRFPRFYK